MEDPIIEVNEGKLRGKLSWNVNNKPFYSFKGIPYAKPPLGELRFCAPQPPEPWKGIRDATRNCNICVQYDRATNKVIGDEDCLFLNVYTPKLPSDDRNKLPVMVLIHGGGFLFGNGTDDTIHGPDYLIEKDVVIVSFNYRLGVLGFLSLNIKEATGNMGLRDQVQMLKWIKQNVNKFNGDPNNVTLFGFSAGAASVEFLLLSPMAKGLFHKGIAQSGSTLSHWAQNDKIHELVKKMGLLKFKSILDNQQLLALLKKLPAKELISLSMEALSVANWRGGIYFGFVPTIEKPSNWEPFLSESTYKLLSKGEFPKIPYLSGFCSHEGLLVTFHSPNVFEKLKTERYFMDHLPFDVQNHEITEIENKFKTMYLESAGKNEENDSFVIDFFTDIDFLASVCIAIKFIAKRNNPVYLYEFSYDGELNYLKKKLNINRKGACHGDDGGYLIQSGILTKEPSEVAKKVRERLLQMWTNFAKLGNPTPITNDLITTKWKPIDDESELPYLVMNSDLVMKNNPYPERVELFEELYNKYYDH